MLLNNESPNCGIDDNYLNAEIRVLTPIDYSKRDRLPENSPRKTLPRGRPKAEDIVKLILNSKASKTKHKCQSCQRLFVRAKNLRMHERVHLGERGKDHFCDYPGCGKGFVQSGQLKTHLRLHTDERPFLCSYTGCTTRFRHSNRECPNHKEMKLNRVAEPIKEIFHRYRQKSENLTVEEQKWFHGYFVTNGISLEELNQPHVELPLTPIQTQNEDLELLQDTKVFLGFRNSVIVTPETSPRAQFHAAVKKIKMFQSLESANASTSAYDNHSSCLRFPVFV